MTILPPLRGDTAQVFISYSHIDPDGQIATKLQERLEADGFAVWADSKIGLGQDWVEQIDTQLRRSSYLVALLSPTSIKSDMVRREIAIAYGLKKAGKLTILPVRLGLHDELPYELGAYLDHIQYVSWQPGESLETIFQAILGGIQGRAVPIQPKTPAPTNSHSVMKRLAPPQLDAITAHVARHLGPVARVVVDEAARKAQSWDELCQLLSTEIPAGEERRKFEAGMRSVRDFRTAS